MQGSNKKPSRHIQFLSFFILLQTRENEYFYWVVRNKKRNIEEGKRHLGLEEHEEIELKHLGRVESKFGLRENNEEQFEKRREKRANIEDKGDGSGKEDVHEFGKSFQRREGRSTQRRDGGSTRRWDGISSQ